MQCTSTSRYSCAAERARESAPAAGRGRGRARLGPYEYDELHVLGSLLVARRRRPAGPRPRAHATPPPAASRGRVQAAFQRDCGTELRMSMQCAG